MQSSTQTRNPKSRPMRVILGPRNDYAGTEFHCIGISGFPTPTVGAPSHSQDFCIWTFLALQFMETPISLKLGAGSTDMDGSFCEGARHQMQQLSALTTRCATVMTVANAQAPKARTRPTTSVAVVCIKVDVGFIV